LGQRAIIYMMGWTGTPVRETLNKLVSTTSHDISLPWVSYIIF